MGWDWSDGKFDGVAPVFPIFSIHTIGSMPVMIVLYIVTIDHTLTLKDRTLSKLEHLVKLGAKPAESPYVLAKNW
jgi:hypothetical protein